MDFITITYMKKIHWLLLVVSAVLYAVPFLLSAYLWWLIFAFPVALLYLVSVANVSFVHGYIWGCIFFGLHMSGGIYVVTCMAHDSWVVGVMLGLVMVLYQALFSGLVFCGVTKIISISSITSPVMRLLMWTIGIWVLIVWTDWYSLWIFGVKEGYPLMHPLIPLAQNPTLLCLLPIIGKQLLTLFLLLVPASFVLLLRYKNNTGVFVFCSAIAFWFICWWVGRAEIQRFCWQARIRTLPYMAHSCVDNPLVVVKVVGSKLQKIIADYPEAEIVIMPESAFNVSNFNDFPELLQLWNANNLGRAVHVVFGASRWHEDCYYNSLHWVYNGVLQNCYDKRHAMLVSERLSSWMNNKTMQRVYFSNDFPIAISLDKRIKLALLPDISFVPYICSELFFNEGPNDIYGESPIILVVNDSMFLGNWCVLYIQELLVLLARYKAIQWQRDIVYVSYGQSLFIDKHGLLKKI